MEPNHWTPINETMTAIPLWAKQASESVGGTLFSEFRFDDLNRCRLRFRRITEKQKKYYAESVLWASRSIFPAGIFICLPENAYGISLKLQLQQHARNYAAFELVKNTITVASHFMDYTPDVSEFSLLLSEREERKGELLQLFLPHYVECEILDLNWLDQAGNVLLEAQFAESHLNNSKPKYLALGDSITQGMDAIYPTSSFPNLLSNFFGWNCLNQGIGGHGFDVNSLDPDLPFVPDIITVAYGTNNWSSNMDADIFKKQAGDFLTQVHNQWPKAILFVISPLWRDDWKLEKKYGNFLNMDQDLAQIIVGWENTHLINGFMLVPHVKHPCMREDGLHPSDEGFARFSLELIQLINKVMNKVIN